MLTSMAMRNFKSWRDTGAIPLAPITAVFGSNSSGKTSLLQMLLMMKQTADSPDRSQVLNLGNERTLVDLGTWEEIVHDHDLAAPIDLSVNWTLAEPLVVRDPETEQEVLFKGDALGLTSKMAWKGNGAAEHGRARVEEFAYSFQGRRFGMQSKSDGKEDYTLFHDHPKFEFKRRPGRVWPLPRPAKFYGFPDQVRAYHQNAQFLSDFELEFEKLCGRILYLGPLREYPRREYTWAGGRPEDMGTRGEKVVDALLASREEGRIIRRGRGKQSLTLEERVAQWLAQLGLITHFEVRRIKAGGKLYQVWVQRDSSSPEVLLTDVGFGVSQILPVIALCYYAPEGATVVLEQPEIHLHPRVQAGLADVFIDAIKTRGIQILLESHSEHLLRRLQLRIAEEQFEHDHAALYFCKMEAGESKLVPLHLDLVGTIDNWPDGFFGDEYAEIEARTLAALHRKKKLGS